LGGKGLSIRRNSGVAVNRHLQHLTFVHTLRTEYRQVYQCQFLCAKVMIFARTERSELMTGSYRKAPERRSPAAVDSNALAIPDRSACGRAADAPIPLPAARSWADFYYRGACVWDGALKSSGTNLAPHALRSPQGGNHHETADRIPGTRALF
jgi:hypothetical protein